MGRLLDAPPVCVRCLPCVPVGVRLRGTAPVRVPATCGRLNASSAAPAHLRAPSSCSAVPPCPPRRWTGRLRPQVVARQRRQQKRRPRGAQLRRPLRRRARRAPQRRAAAPAASAGAPCCNHKHVCRVDPEVQQPCNGQPGLTARPRGQQHQSLSRCSLVVAFATSSFLVGVQFRRCALPFSCSISRLHLDKNTHVTFGPDAGCRGGWVSCGCRSWLQPPAAHEKRHHARQCKQGHCSALGCCLAAALEARWPPCNL